MMCTSSTQARRSGARTCFFMTSERKNCFHEVKAARHEHDFPCCFNQAGFFSSAATEVGSDIFVIGGANSQATLGDVYRLDLVRKRWTKLEQPAGLKLSNRTSHAAVATTAGAADQPRVFGRLFLFGGYDAEGNFLNDLWVLRPTLSPPFSPDAPDVLETAALAWSRPVPVGEFLASKPQRWHRRLVQRPWLLPVIAMHLAARRLQRAWRTNWLQRTKPSAIGAEEEGLPVTPPVTPAPRKLHVAHAALRLRHIEHLRRRMVLPRDQAQEKGGPLGVKMIWVVGLENRDANYPVYESFESFCLALIQGWWQSKVHVWRVRRVQSYMGRKLYQVAAFEIQQAWQLYEHRLRSRSLDQSSWTEQEQLVHYAKMLAEAARKIQHKWRSYKDRGVFETLQETIAMFRRSGDPYLLLRAVLPREAVLLDPAMQVHVRFRLGGPRFPPSIFYKIYTHGNVVDLGSFAPREYHLERMSQEQGLALPGDLGWYRRVENNGWRPLAVRFASEGLVDKDVEKFTGRRAQNFHYSKLRRRQDTRWSTRADAAPDGRGAGAGRMGLSPERVPEPREGHSLTLLDEQLLLFGGYTAAGTETNDLHMYDISKQTWKQVAVSGAGPSPRQAHSAARHGHQLVVAGGCSGSVCFSDVFVPYALARTRRTQCYLRGWPHVRVRWLPGLLRVLQRCVGAGHPRALSRAVRGARNLCGWALLPMHHAGFHGP
eukprot:g31022.t2